MDLEIKEDKLAPVRIYQRQVWLDEYNKPIYKEIRDKVLDAFKDLVFIEEGHKYFVGDRSLTSVTTLIGNFEPHFDADAQAPRTMAKYFDDETSIYYQKTVDEIKEMWKANNKRATTHGSERHEFAESVFHFMTHNYDAILPAFKDRLMQDENGVDYFLATNAKEIAVSKVYKDIPDCVVPILAETKVYNIKDEYAYSGTFDILFYYNAELNGKDKSKSGLYVLDWKGLDINTPILTTKGWKTMGTVEVGDIVFDKNGEETKVLHTSEVHHKPCYKITFDNGESIIADEEHRWEIWEKTSMKSNVYTTKEIYECSDVIYINTCYDLHNAMMYDMDKKIKETTKRLVITCISSTNTIPTRCIEVDSPTHTFCYGYGMTVTHNTNKDIYKNYNGQTMEPPFTDMRNMPKNAYVLQLNAYQMALEKIGLNVIARMLFWLLPDGSYQKVPLENMTERLEKALVEKGIK